MVTQIILPPDLVHIATIDDIDADLTLLNWRLCIKKSGLYVNRFIYVGTKHKSFMLHREILSRMVGRSLLHMEFADHIDHNGLNNCRSNLRLATPSQNAANSKSHSGTRSGYKGVYPKRKKWQARIKVNYQEIVLGVFKTPEEAYEAYKRAAREYFGEFAYYE